MEKLILIALIQITVCLIYVKIGYDRGYAKREKQFQENPINYIIGAENAIRVENGGHKTKVFIYNEKLVDIVKL
jgi:hypothetical protein